MSRRTLTVLITILFLALALAIYTSDRGVSGVMETIGSAISRVFD
jgi:hypothetical protein